jgi:hypothetical protein
MRKSALLFGAAAMAVGSAAFATTYGPGSGGAIPDHVGTPSPGPATSSFVSTIAVPAATGNVVSVDSVSITMGPAPANTPTGAHSWIGDLTFTLTAPNGDNVHLMSRLGATTSTSFGSSGDFIGGPFVFVDGGGAAMPTTGNPAPGTYNRFTNATVGAFPPADPDGYGVFAGDLADGNWTLTITDHGNGDSGGLASWSLNLTTAGGVVPEPASLGLLGAGIMLPLLRRRRA